MKTNTLLPKLPSLRAPKGRSNPLLFLILSFIFAYSVAAANEDSLAVSLVYPQPSNAAKRQAKKSEPPIVIKGKILINIVGINPEQLKHPDLYAEYFLDNNLIYSSKNTQSKHNLLTFTFDTGSYPDGKHALIVNLWDTGGPSAIGMRDIIIQNAAKNED